jgi:hypothetical protein
MDEQFCCNLANRYPTNIQIKGLGGILQIDELIHIDFEHNSAPYAHTFGLCKQHDLAEGLNGLIGNDFIDRYPQVLLELFGKQQEESLVKASPNENPKEVVGASEQELLQVITTLVLPVMEINVDNPQPAISRKGYPTPPKWREAGESLIQNMVEKQILEDITETHQNFFRLDKSWLLRPEVK